MKPKIVILNSKDKKILKRQLNDQFGVKELPDFVYFCLNKKEKVYICNRECFDIEHFSIRVNTFGNYFGRYMPEGFRLSVEGSQLIGPYASKNVFECTLKQRDNWLHGLDIDSKTTTCEGPYVLITHKNDFYGCGKLKENKILNYLPKSRMIKHIFKRNEEQIPIEDEQE
ncbi:MAG: methyltransferase RsmF C-terminal domain-like protein [Candidatus Woesearchaeota archaeon]